MIDRAVTAIRVALSHLKQHPQLLIAFLLLIVVPLLFLYSGQQFLEVGRANQERLQKDRVGLMQDVFSSVVVASQFSPTVIQAEIDTIAELNPDIVAFRVVRNRPIGFVPIAALTREQIGEPESESELYRRAAVALDETLIFEFSRDGERVWQALRAIPSTDGSYSVIFTEFNLSSIDEMFAARERDALWTLGIIYIVFLLIAFWLIRQTDFRALYMEARQANETKDLFTNMIAHELRAPLTAIRGYASMVGERVQDPKDIEEVGHITEASERLLAIVNDLLDVARIQSGKLRLAYDHVDITAIIANVIAEQQVSASAKHITVTQTGITESVMISADKTRLQQALTNLVSNAIKYTPTGTIAVDLQATTRTVTIRVKDTGMGISAEDQAKVFAPFFRVETEDVSKITGSGLGMWITKQIIELHEGTIAVESIKNVGTHVVVCLPVNASK